MTAPIDLPCPTCGATSGNYCVTRQDVSAGSELPDWREIRLDVHHAARVDDAARQTDRGRRGDPDRLREVLREALDGWDARDPEGLDVRQRGAIRVEFGLS